MTKSRTRLLLGDATWYIHRVFLRESDVVGRRERERNRQTETKEEKHLHPENNGRAH